MANTNDFLAFAIGGGANVDSQATFAASGYLGPGFSTGTAFSNQLNKVWRQSSTWANVLGSFLNQAQLDALDNGTPATLLTSLTTAVKAAVGQTAQVVTFSATPVFDCSKGLKFEITLTGNVTSSTLTNVPNGVTIQFTIKQDGTGGRTFVPPSGVPIDTIDPTANAASVQKIEVSSTGAFRAATPMVVSAA
jgi:hypothetical protein